MIPFKMQLFCTFRHVHQCSRGDFMKITVIHDNHDFEQYCKTKTLFPQDKIHLTYIFIMIYLPFPQASFKKLTNLHGKCHRHWIGGYHSFHLSAIPFNRIIFPCSQTKVRRRFPAAASGNEHNQSFAVWLDHLIGWWYFAVHFTVIFRSRHYIICFIYAFIHSSIFDPFIKVSHSSAHKWPGWVQHHFQLNDSPAYPTMLIKSQILPWNFPFCCYYQKKISPYCIPLHFI